MKVHQNWFRASVLWLRAGQEIKQWRVNCIFYAAHLSFPRYISSSFSNMDLKMFHIVTIFSRKCDPSYDLASFYIIQNFTSLFEHGPEDVSYNNLFSQTSCRSFGGRRWTAVFLCGWRSGAADDGAVWTSCHTRRMWMSYTHALRRPSATRHNVSTAFSL